MVKLDDYYVVTAIENGERVYVRLDSNSGGYPYWSSYGPEKKHKNMIDAIQEMNHDVYGSGIKYMQTRVKDIQVARVTTTLTFIDLNSDEVIKQIRENALKKLNAEERAILGLK